MARFRNDHGEDRIVPTLGYVLVPAGDTVTVPDDERHHWDAGGWTALDPDPRPAPAAAPGPEPVTAPAPPAVPDAPPPPPTAAVATAVPEEAS